MTADEKENFAYLRTVELYTHVNRDFPTDTKILELPDRYKTDIRKLIKLEDKLERRLICFRAATRYFQLQQAHFTDQPNLKYDPDHDWFMEQFGLWSAKQECRDCCHGCAIDRCMMAFELELWDEIWHDEIPFLRQEVLKIVELDAINTIKQGKCSSDYEDHLYEFVTSKQKKKNLMKLMESESRHRERPDDNWKIPDWVEQDAAKRKQKGKSSGRKNQKKTKNQKTKPTTLNTPASVVNSASIFSEINSQSAHNEKEEALINVKERRKTKSEGDSQISIGIEKEITKQKEKENNSRTDQSRVKSKTMWMKTDKINNPKSSEILCKEIVSHKTTEVSKPKKRADVLRSKEVNEIIDGMQQCCNRIEQQVVLD